MTSPAASRLCRPSIWSNAVRLALALAGLASARATVVINEIMYHPPNDRDEYQWVELWNPGPESVDLVGWSFRKGLKFTFTNNTLLATGGFLVVSPDVVAFRQRYGTNPPVVGEFAGRLSHGGETLELVDREGRTVDRVRYDDAEPWPLSPDGLSPSLERLSAALPGDDPRNWAPSPMPPFETPAGTPGAANASARTNLPPDISSVRFDPPIPGTPLQVEARINDPDGVARAVLAYRIVPRPGEPPSAGEEVEIPMEPSSPRGPYTASLPPQRDRTLVRFRIRAVDLTGSERVLPHPDDARPAWTVYFGGLESGVRIPVVSLLQYGVAESAGPNLRTAFQRGPRPPRGRPVAPPARGESVLLYQPPGASIPQVHDFLRITPRQGGWKVRASKGRPIAEMSTVNVIFESQPRFVLSEHLGYELFRAAGAAAPLSGHWRVTHNGRPMGYHLFVEQPNTSFLDRIGRDPKGDLYKILWYGRDVIGQHEKKNNPASGHVLLVATIEGFRGATGAAQWQFIQQRFEVEQCATYFALGQCIQNWDGFFNNHFVYRQPGPQGRWEIFPWDQDKTWGDYDGASPKYDWYTMPLTYGMAGDKPPRGFGGGMGIHGGPSWWRQGGWFSAPLLANPEFRARYLARLRQLCDTVFTPEAFEPVIAGLEYRLEPEVRYRASLLSGRRVASNGWTSPGEMSQTEAEAAARQFHRHIASYREQLAHRREFLLRELARTDVR